MQNVLLIHNCLTFQHKKQKFLYGITLSILNSNFIIKYKPHYLIIPSAPYIYGLFSHAALQLIIKIIIKINKNSGESMRQNKTIYNRQNIDGNKQQLHFLDKTMKFTKLVLSNRVTLSSFYPQQVLERLMDTGIALHLNKFQLKQQQIINKLVQILIKQISLSGSSITNNHTTQSQSIQNKNKFPQLHPWINCPLYQLKIIISQIGMSTYICQGTDLIVVDPTQQFVFYLNNNNTVKCRNQDKQKQIKSGKLLSLLHTIIITKISSVLALIGLMIVNGVNKVRVLVISEYLQKIIIEKAKKYLLFSQQIVRSRLQIRNIANQQRMKLSDKYPILSKNINPYTLQSPNTLSCKYYPLSHQNPSRLQLHFGSSIDIKSNKRIIFYTPTPSDLPTQSSQRKQLEYSTQFQLTHFPKQISDENVQLIVLYKVQEQLMKQLKSMPQIMRKKIILNRNQQKYHHKYFITFQRDKIQYCSITNLQYVNILTNHWLSKNGETKNILASLPDKQVRNKVFETNMECIYDIELGCKIYQMGNNAQIQTFGQVISVYDGFIQVSYTPNQYQKITRNQVIGVRDIQKNGVLKRVTKIRALKYALVKIMMQNDYQIQQNKKQIQKLVKKKYIRPLSHNINSKTTLQQVPQKKRQSSQNFEHIETIQGNSLINSLTSYQKTQLNKICHPVTYQVGFKTNNKNFNVYFISKGGMKWQDNDKLAGNGYFIGDMLSYYGIRERILQKQRQKLIKINKNKELGDNEELEFDNFIEIIKDTWALQINIQQFHKYFILENPHLLHFIFSKGKIFN